MSRVSSIQLYCTPRTPTRTHTNTVYIGAAQLNLTQVGRDYIMSWTTPSPPTHEPCDVVVVEPLTLKVSTYVSNQKQKSLANVSKN